MTGFEAAWLGHRIARRRRSSLRRFHYHSVAASVSENAAVLARFIETLGEETIDLVGHSLGGVVILALLERAPPRPAGRAVLLGAPVQGSRAAHGLARWPGGRGILGRAIAEAVLDARPRTLALTREVGVIAGTVPYGLGRLVARLPEPNDGVVLVEETRLAGARDHIELPVNHSGMLFSRAVADQAAAFLESGRFERPGAVVRSSPA
ncbi:MAG: alpha/beta fold hydrolase [Gammaproteobacteria bacterium]|nr:alpha/beta fold hydrolase [Gammaproteobacteria bacterium]